MDQVYIHLLITHLPIYGSVLGAIVLLQGIIARNNTTLIAAYTVFVLSAIGAGIAYLTGEGAEEAVEHIQGVSEEMIEEHEDAGKFALIGFIILGLLSLVALFFTRKQSVHTRKLAFAVGIAALVCFVIAMRTGHLGGKIRHTEIDNAAAATTLTIPAEDRGEEHEEND